MHTYKQWTQIWHDIAYLCWKCRKTPTN